MKAIHKTEKSVILTILGMAVMIIAVAVKAATSSLIAAAVIHIVGLACFFIIEGIEKTPDSESGLLACGNRRRRGLRRGTLFCRRCWDRCM